MKLKFTLLFPLILMSLLIQSQTNWDTIIQNNLKDIVKQHKAFVSIPNLPENEELMLKNINWVANNYRTLDFKINLLESSTLPLLLLEKEYNPNYKTVLFYFHIDGQPVDANKWNQENPFIPVLKHKDDKGNWKTLNWDVIDKNINDEWRIFARAAADDKAPITMLFNALKFLKAEGVNPKFNIKIIFDPEEEYGSNAFLSTINTYKNQYAADAMIIMDGPAHESNKPTLTFGCRGIATCTITTYGSKLPQHSGHYGNYAPNPVFSLASILSSMKDDNGKVLIKDFYSGIDISPEEQQILNNVPDNAKALNTRLGIVQPEAVGKNYQESLQYPSLNIRGMSSAWIGKQTRTIVPDKATAQLGIRLVPESDGDRLLELVRQHIRSKGYYLLEREPTDAERLKHPKIATFVGSKWVNAFRTEINSSMGQWLTTALKNVHEREPVKIRIMGGTVPVTPLIEALGIPAAIIPMVNMDNNQHSPNENLRLGNLVDGIKTCVGILSYSGEIK